MFYGITSYRERVLGRRWTPGRACGKQQLIPHFFRDMANKRDKAIKVTSVYMERVRGLLMGTEQGTVYLDWRGSKSLPIRKSVPNILQISI